MDDGTSLPNELSDFEKDELYYRTLLRLQELYRTYNKRYLEEEPLSDDRTSRHCGGDLFNKMHASKLRYLERSRLMADRIAQSAMKLAQRREQKLQSVLSAPNCLPVPYCGDKKRDIEVSSASAASSATSLDASIGAGGVNIDTSHDSNIAKASSVQTALGSTSSSSSSAVSTDSHLATSVGGGLSTGLSSNTATSLNTNLNVGSTLGSSLGTSLGSRLATNSRLGSYLGGGSLASQLATSEDYERRMIMDMAIEEAAAMIRKLYYETRSELMTREDPEFERRVLGLAIDMVNKATRGLVGNLGNLDIFDGYRYNNVDDYLRASLDDEELEEADWVSNAGFDYVHQGLDRLAGYDVDNYIGHPSPYSRGRCETCSRFDMRTGAPLCKRSGHVFQGRAKRGPPGDRARVHHLARAAAARNKVVALAK